MLVLVAGLDWSISTTIDLVAAREIMIQIHDSGETMKLVMHMTNFTPIDIQATRPHHILTTIIDKLTKTAIPPLVTVMIDIHLRLPRIEAIMEDTTTNTIIMEVAMETDETTEAMIEAGPLLFTFRTCSMGVSSPWLC